MLNSNKITFSSGLVGEYSPYYLIKGNNAKIYNTLKELIEDNSEIRYELDIACCVISY